VKRFCKQSAIALPLSVGWHVNPKWPRIALDAFHLSLFTHDPAIGHTAWGVISHLPTIVSHSSSAFLQVIHLIIFFSSNNGRFTCWIPGYLSQIPSPPPMFQQTYQTICCLGPRMLFFLSTVYEYTRRRYMGSKVARHFIGFFSRVDLDCR
jgi:hypothetical protein